MKIQLPNIKTSLKGFTLIELLVVIAILAILAIIGFAVFSNLGAQAKARNISRRADLDSIAKALEVNKITGGNYLALANSQFSNGVIPAADGQGYPYCANFAASTQPADPSAWTTTCPSAGTTWNPVGTGYPPAGTVWKICTSLEAEVNPTKAATVFCKLSAQ
ncbi:prepilin-type N-terminal cleavage/methylation domain-containing protein [Candidatus Daviesbacteria bacterium]|nr:prepilin-type N-terminal cleavage/methylation domain-containing protein [Candidatus Daviesbacteria bacterium]